MYVVRILRHAPSFRFKIVARMQSFTLRLTMSEIKDILRHGILLVDYKPNSVIIRTISNRILTFQL